MNMGIDIKDNKFGTSKNNNKDVFSFSIVGKFYLCSSVSLSYITLHL